MSYKDALAKGIAKEQARALLPEGLTQSTIYMAGSLRSWIHYCDLRRGNGTQKEHSEVADKCWEIIGVHFPDIVKALEDD
jgi:thymidylate synthase (FAD)